MVIGGVVKKFLVPQNSMTPDAAKIISESFLREHGIEINVTLPIIETPSELSPQTSKAVATRGVVLSYIIGLGFGASGGQIKPALVDYGLIDALSANELQLVNSDAISDQDKINCTWLTECAQSLAYCLGLADLDPFRPCDDDLASHFPDPFSDPNPFIESAALRSFDDVYLQADLHYRIHWAARNSRLTGTGCPVKESFIRERRRPLDWVIGVEADWDEIPLDT